MVSAHRYIPGGMERVKNMILQFSAVLLHLANVVYPQGTPA